MINIFLQIRRYFQLLIYVLKVWTLQHPMIKNVFRRIPSRMAAPKKLWCLEHLGLGKGGKGWELFKDGENGEGYFSCSYTTLEPMAIRT